MEHMQRIIAVHSPGVFTIVADNARRHKHTATGSAEVLPALWQFAKAHRRRRGSSSSSSQNNNSHHEALPADLRWAAQETTTMSAFSPKPHGTMRPLKQSLPTPPLVCQSPSPQRSSPMSSSNPSPGGSPRDFMSSQSPKRPQRQPSAAIIIDRSPRKPERRKVSPPIGTTIAEPSKPSPDSVLAAIPVSPVAAPIRRRHPIALPSPTTTMPKIVNDFRDDTPAPATKKSTMNRESLAQAIHFFDLDTDSDDSDELDNSSFGEDYYDEETRDDDTAPTTRIRQFPHVHML